MVLVYSSTKGVAATCAHRVVDEGRLDLCAPVAEYWPEFAQAGKAEVTVADVLSHQAGLAWVDEELTLAQVLEGGPLLDALARQTPLWEPRSAHGYHAVTYGTLVGEILRRVTGRSLGAYFAAEIAGPLGLEFHIGLPAALEPRVAPLLGNLGGQPGGEGGAEVDAAALASLAELIGPASKLGRALSINGAFTRLGDIPAPGGNVFNSREVHAAELPAANGIGDARSLARMYAACIGEVDGVRLITEARMKDAATRRTVGPDIVILDLDLQFGLGYFVPSTIMTIGGPAFAYVMNRMDLGLAGDVRSYSLAEACYDAIA